MILSLLQRMELDMAYRYGLGTYNFFREQVTWQVDSNTGNWVVYGEEGTITDTYIPASGVIFGERNGMPGIAHTENPNASRRNYDLNYRKPVASTRLNADMRYRIRRNVQRAMEQGREVVVGVQTSAAVA